jgi:4-amino-4-deoxy-L-arabinose transferase-like glycosyltransferase
MGQVRARLRANSSRRLAGWGSSKGAACLVLLILLVAFVLRLYRLGYQSLWYDEAVSVYLASKGLVALTQHTAGDIHPPLYYYLLHFWILVAGVSEFSAAFFSLIFGMVLVAGCFRLGHELLDRRVGLLAAFVVAVSPFNIWYSQEVRMYTLGAFLGLVSLYCLAKLAGLSGRDSGADRQYKGPSPPRRRRWIFWLGYILSAAAGLYTLYYFAFLVLFENLFVIGWWLAARYQDRDSPLSLERWLLAQALVIILYAPWIPTAARQALQPPVPPWRGFTGLASAIVESWSALALGQSVEPGSLVVWPVLLFFLAVYLLGLLGLVRGRQRWPTGALLCGYTFAPLAIIYLLSLHTPLFHARYVFTYSPPFYLLVAAGLVEINRRTRLAMLIGLAAITLASGYSVYRMHFEPRYASDDHRAAVSYIKQRLAPGDAVLINAGYAYPAFLYYYDGELSWRGRLVDYGPGLGSDEGVVLLQTGSIGGSESLGWDDPESDFYPTTAKETERALGWVFDQHERVWVYRIYDTVTDPDGVIRRWLDEHGRQIGDQEFTGESYMRVQCYATRAEPVYDPTTVAHDLDRELAPGLILAGYKAPAMVRAGEEVRLLLRWEQSGDLTDDFDLLVGLTTKESNGVTEWSANEWSKVEILGGVRATEQVVELEVAPGTIPVEHRVIVEVRNASTTEETAGSRAGRAVIGEIRVLRPIVPSPTPPMPHQPWANFGDAIELVGYGLEPVEGQDYRKLCVELLWRAWDVPLPLVEVVAVFEEDGTEIAEASSSLTETYPSTLWGREELVRDMVRLPVSGSQSQDSYQVRLRLVTIRVDGTRDLVTVWSPSKRWEESLLLGEVTVP